MKLDNANQFFTDDEMRYVLLVAVYGRREGLDKLRQMKIDGVAEAMQTLHGSVIGKMERLSDEDFNNVDFISFLERCMMKKGEKHG